MTGLGTYSNVLTIDYRGFGDSSGTPSEQGLIIDARTAWDYVSSMSNIHTEPQENMVLVGTSLGTGVVAQLAGQLAKESQSTLLEVENSLNWIQVKDREPSSYQRLKVNQICHVWRGLNAYLDSSYPEYFRSFLVYKFDSTAALAVSGFILYHSSLSRMLWKIEINFLRSSGFAFTSRA